MFAAALCVNGKVVTGSNHGDAYGKLNTLEKEENIISGWFDEEENQFINEEENEERWYCKEIIFIRHALTDKIDDLTNKGMEDTQKIKLNLKDYPLFSSPYHRCLQTAKIINNDISVDPRLREQFQETNQQFLSRLEEIIRDLPEKSIVVTHHDVIIAMLHIAIGEIIKEINIPHSSITHINRRQILCCGKVG